MKEPHHLICEAPICNDDPNSKYGNEVLWYPGEKVCKRKPYQLFQKRQLEINKLVKAGKFKNVDRAYTANELETGCI